MRRFNSVVAGLLLTIGVLGADHAWAAMKKASCVVCQVARGESAEEEVRAVRSHAGKEYGFCSEKCGKAFSADPLAYVPPSFPRAAPGFSLTDLGGNPVSNASLKGKVVLVDFWATWCAPCLKSMPELEALHRKYADRGFAVVGISIDEGGLAKVRKFVAAKKLTYPIALDSAKEPAWESFRVKAVPAAYLLDREGRIVAQWTGAPANATQLAAKLEELLVTD
ncbi:MAG: redoxin domain-containing protein [Candidatus Eisenbacteria bacterium]